MHQTGFTFRVVGLGLRVRMMLAAANAFSPLHMYTNLTNTRNCVLKCSNRAILFNSNQLLP